MELIIPYRLQLSTWVAKITNIYQGKINSISWSSQSGILNLGIQNLHLHHNWLIAVENTDNFKYNGISGRAIHTMYLFKSMSNLAIFLHWNISEYSQQTATRNHQIRLIRSYKVAVATMVNRTGRMIQPVNPKHHDTLLMWILNKFEDKT